MSIKTHILKNVEAKWCKILGAAPPGYDNGPAEWTLDAILNEQAEKDYLASGGDPFYVKTNKDGEKFIKFSRKATKADGEAAKPIRVQDHQGKEWDQSKLIGNGSVLNIQFSLNEVKSKGKMRRKPSILAVQVWNHEPYKGRNDFPIKEIDTPDTTSDWDSQ